MATAEPSPRAPLSIFSYVVLPDLFLSFLIATRPRTPVRLLAFLLYTYVSFRALRFTTGDPLQNYSIGCTISGQLFTAIHLLWLTEPVRDFRHERDTIEKRDPATLPLWSRLYWSLCAIHSPRGVGWSYQVANVLPPPSSSRWAFVRSRLTQAAAYFLLIDLSQFYVHANPLFSLMGDDALSITSQGYFLRCVNIVAWMSGMYGMMNMQYCLVGAISVALGISEPKYWSELFGKWSDAYTIRRFWGRTWHQLLRRHVTSIGKFFSRSLGFSPGTRASSYTQLYVAFIVSGLMHSAGGDAMVGLQFLGASFPFFFYQALAITLEDAVIGIARRVGFTHVHGWTRALGFLWVFVWFSLSMPGYLNFSIRAGIGRSEVIPVSLVRGVLGVIKNTFQITSW